MNSHGPIAVTWAQRAQAELGAVVRFKELSEALICQGASPKVVSLATKAMSEEARHAKLCSKIALELGHPTGYAFFEGQSFSIQKGWQKLKSEKQRLLCEVVLMCCLTETVNAGLMNTLYHRSQKDRYAQAIREILEDEIKHSQLGWAYLTEYSNRHTISFVRHYLPEMLELSVKDELFTSHKQHTIEVDDKLGVLPIDERLDQFEQVLYQVFFPGMERLGVDTGPAREWLKVKSSGIA